jgi:hypothetical protein
MADLTGKIHSVAFSVDGKPLISFEVNEGQTALKMAQKFKDSPIIKLKVTEYKAKRSLDANAYYWLLIGKLSKALNISTSYCHNVMLRRYGVLEMFDDKPVYLMIQDTDEASRKADEAETYHIKPTSNVREGNDGKMYRTYMMLKGSHEYDTAEMATLIAGIRSECINVGIPVETPNEIASLLSLMGGR